MSTHHLNNAHIAIAQIDNVHINSTSEHITMIHNRIAKNHIILNKHPPCSFSFVKELITHEVPAKMRTIHKMISMNVQYTPGAQIVIIQHKIRMKARDAINHTGHFFFSVGVFVLVLF